VIASQPVIDCEPREKKALLAVTGAAKEHAYK
jgi:hypothetical protein